MARAICVSLLLLASCGAPEKKQDEPAPAAPQVGTVIFSYRAPTARDPNIADCGVGATHIHPSWRDYELIPFLHGGSTEWTRTFSDVPLSRRMRIRVSDANECNNDPNGATTKNVYANGVLLTDIVDTPGTGTEPGLAFLLQTDGGVAP